MGPLRMLLLAATAVLIVASPAGASPYDITINKSLPINEHEIWGEIRQLDGLVDPLTQLKMIPSIDDPEAVFKAVREMGKESKTDEAEPKQASV